MKVGIRLTGKDGKRSWLIVDVIGHVDHLGEDVVFVVDVDEFPGGLVGIADELVGECEVK